MDKEGLGKMYFKTRMTCSVVLSGFLELLTTGSAHDLHKDVCAVFPEFQNAFSQFFKVLFICSLNATS